MLLRTWQELQYRLDVLHAAKVASTEVYQDDKQTKNLSTSHNKVDVPSSACLKNALTRTSGGTLWTLCYE